MHHYSSTSVHHVQDPESNSVTRKESQDGEDYICSDAETKWWSVIIVISRDLIIREWRRTRSLLKLLHVTAITTVSE